MDFSICFFAGGQMFPGTLAVPWAAITAASPTTAGGDEGENGGVSDS